MIRLLHLADLHIGYAANRLGDRAEERSREFSRSLERAIDFAMNDDNRIDAVLFAGDVFDRHNPEPDVVDFFRNQCRRLAAVDKPAFLIPGNHDAFFYPDCVYHLEKFPGLRLLQAPNIGEPESVIIRGETVHFYGMAHQPGLSRPPYDEFKAVDLPGYHVALLHGSLLLDPRWEENQLFVPIRAERLRESGMDYIALGHFHDYKNVGNTGRPIVYCGSLERKRTFERADRVLVIAELNETGTRVETFSFDARPYVEVEIDVFGVDEDAVEVLADRIRQKVPHGAIAFVIFSGATANPLPLAALQKVLQDDFFHLEFDDQTFIWQSEQILRLAEEPTVRGVFVRRMREKIEQASEAERSRLNLALKLALSEFLRYEQVHSIS